LYGNRLYIASSLSSVAVIWNNFVIRFDLHKIHTAFPLPFINSYIHGMVSNYTMYWQHIKESVSFKN